MQVKLDWFVVILIVVSGAVGPTKPIFCQSVAVQVPGGRLGSVRASASWPPNTLTAEMRRWEAILDQAYPNHFNRTLSGRELLAEMNRVGLPTVLTGSARDDSLDYDREIELPLPNSSLRTRLIAGLKDNNATICYFENRIGIISLDDSGDSEYFLTVTYDVTALAQGEPYNLIDSITGSVNPDAWQDTGQGLGTIVANQVNGRQLITISQEYSIHRDVQRLLNGFNRLSSSSPPNPHSS